MPYAFRCKNCGRLHNAEHAGENEIPHACCVCGAGVTLGFDPQLLHQELANAVPVGKALTDAEVKELAKKLHAAISKLPTEKKLHPENWEVLAEATPDRVKELGLLPEDVTKHTPFPATDPDRKPQVVVAHAVEQVTGKVTGKAEKTEK